MAEAVLFNIAEDLLKNMASKALEEIAAAWGFKDQLEKLRDTTTTIKDMLSDAERKQVESKPVRGWLEKLRDVVYDADDLFDEFSTMVTRKELMKGSKLSKEARLFFSSSNQLAFAFKMAREVKKIRGRLDDAVKNADQFAFRRLHGSDGQAAAVKVIDRETCSYVKVDEVIGREEDKNAIVDMLLDPYNAAGEKISVVSIVGIGGLGKTTLAQLLCNDEKIEEQFQLKLWVCVSDVFDIKVIIENILKSGTGMNLEQLQRKLRELIDGKKYLLVLDDLWNENRAEWLRLRDLLMVGGIGSKILVTTRSRDVATVVGGAIHDLKGLSEDKSWSLFERMAFEVGQPQRNPNLFMVGKEIVKKCANVPLAITTLASLLFGKDESMWLSVKENELPKIAEGGDSIMTILEISYHHLPSPLKNCFAYCALFPKDYDMHKETLIYLWMAQGFLVPSHEGQSLEVVGEMYFQSLLQRCFFQDVTRDEFGDIRSCKMHDLMHDLARRVAGNESKVIELGTRDIDKGPAHHLSFGHRSSSSSVIPFQLKPLRTFLLPAQYNLPEDEFSKTLCGRIISSFSCLRVLDLHRLGIETLPSSIGGLVHLRYLDLSKNYGLTLLPASITELQNLQTLKLNFCLKLKVLPADVKKLINLRHLGLGVCPSLASMPAGMGTLTALHKLDVFIVDHRASVSETKTARLRDLKALDKLSGRLRIQILGEMKDPVNEAKEANLSSKHGLSELHLGGDSWDPKLDEAVLDGLQPPPNLQKLQIGDYRGQSLPTWASMDGLNRSLPNLVEVELRNWGSCPNVPLFSRLRSLKRLRLDSLKSVEYMENSRYDASSSSSSTSFFPSLEELQLWEMVKLKSWWGMEAGAAVDAGERTSSSTSSTEVQPQHIQPSFPRLLKLEIKICPSLKSMPLCPNVEKLELACVNKELRVLTAVVMPREGASRLKTMSGDIGGLISLPTDCLRGLTSLKITDDPKLLDLSSLAEVFRSLSSLESLEITNCNGLRSLHGGLEHLSSKCEQLDLSAEDKEIGMPWKALKGLQSLELRSLPKVKTLPEGIRFLTSLKRLDIVGCSGLRERCRGPNGDDWPKIRHIPVVKVWD